MGKDTKEEAKGVDEPAAKKQKVETETKSVKKAMTFVSLAETLKVDWSSELYSRRIKRMDPSYFLLQILFEFVAQEIIKAISNKDAPHNNYFFYNPVESCGVVET